jgi:hypothetical protein
MRKEIQLSFISDDGKIEEIVTKEIDKISEKYGVTFFKKINTTYYFSELPEDIQKKIIERKRDTNVFFDWWKWNLEDWKNKLASIGFDDADIRFSGFWSQGDGASFTAYCDTDKILNNLLLCEGKIVDYKQWRLWFELAENGIFKFDISRNGSNYVHEHTVSGVIHEDFGGLNDRMWYAANPEKPYNFTCKFEQKANLDYLEAMFDSYVKDLCREIYKKLEEEYEYLTSDDCIKEYLENQDDEYDKYGNDAS